MKRKLQIYVNDIFYREIEVEANDTGGYNIGEVLNIINTDKQAGAFDTWNLPPGVFSVSIRLQPR